MSTRRNRSVRMTPSFAGLKSSSLGASAAASAASRKSDTKPEIALRRALRRLGIRSRASNSAIQGRPDLVFPRQRIAVFCDGDFWHGRNLASRVRKLSAGHNAQYWSAKIQGNVERDRRITALLRRSGWTVVRFWESKLLADPAVAAWRLARLVEDKRTKGLDR